MSSSITLTVELYGCEFDVDVCARLSSGGSNRWGSDEPPWFDVDIESVRGVGKKKDISNRLHDRIMDRYSDVIDSLFFDHYY